MACSGAKKLLILAVLAQIHGPILCRANHFLVTNRSNDIHGVDDRYSHDRLRSLQNEGIFEDSNDDGLPKTRKPTDAPSTGMPSPNPTVKPTSKPSHTPSNNPTAKPTSKPTQKPSAVPSRNPTNEPSPNPTKVPTPDPTPFPTPRPSSRTMTAAPISPLPKTRAPTFEPTTKSPTPIPTKLPTMRPTVPPTFKPTKKPTHVPTKAPTDLPTGGSTVKPPSENYLSNLLPAEESQPKSKKPSKPPTYSPTIPSMDPTLAPSKLVSISVVPIETFSLRLHSYVDGEVDEGEVDRIVADFLMQQLPNELPVKFVLDEVVIESYLSTLPNRKLSQENETESLFEYDFFVSGNASFVGDLLPTSSELTGMVLLSFENNQSLFMSLLYDSQDQVLASTEVIIASQLEQSAEKVVVDDGHLSEDESSDFNYLYILVTILPAVALVSASAYYRKVTSNSAQYEEDFDDDIEAGFESRVSSKGQNPQVDSRHSTSFVEVSQAPSLASKKSVRSAHSKRSSKKSNKLKGVVEIDEEIEKPKKRSRERLEKELQKMQKRLDKLEKSRAGALFAESGSMDNDSYGGSEGGCQVTNDVSCFDPTFIQGGGRGDISVHSYDDSVQSTGFDCGLSVAY